MPQYLPILFLGALAVGFALFTLVVSQLLGRPRPNAAKSATYECGLPALGRGAERFPVKFYLVCMIFILLDVDAAFLYPWALILKQQAATNGTFLLLEMGAFLTLIGGGFAYAWKVGALDW